MQRVFEELPRLAILGQPPSTSTTLSKYAKAFGAIKYSQE